MPKELFSLEKTLNQIIVGKPKQIRLALVCLLAQGHLLLEDLPGSGKTTLAKSLAALLGLKTRRVQFTADLLPADILGSVIYRPESQRFVLQRGAIFTHILLADEINRSSPKCQSALLEAMEEGQVSIEGKTLPLDAPFFVIATQNPTEQYGTYPLPESQLDRFLFCLSLGYLSQADEIAVLSGQSRAHLLEKLSPLLTAKQLLAYQAIIPTVYLSPAIVNYCQALLKVSRENGQFLHGLSTRAGLALVRAAQAYAFMQGEKSVFPEHVQAVFPAIATHRLVPISRQQHHPGYRRDLVSNLLKEVNLDL